MHCHSTTPSQFKASHSFPIVPIAIDPHRHRTKHTIQPFPQLPQLLHLIHPLLLDIPQLRLQLPNLTLLVRLRSPDPRQHGNQILDLLFFDNEVPRQLPLSRRESGGRVWRRWQIGVLGFGAFCCCAGLLCWWGYGGCLCCVGAGCGGCGDGGGDWWRGYRFGYFC